jgi:hypothetical protein
MISRSILAAALLAACAQAQPQRTTIQDVLYKADGTRFNGILTIAWTSFEAPDQSNIVNQTTTAKVVNGNLQVQLVPTTTSSPAVFYTVTYNSDGRIQFKETWAVPSSNRPLRVRDVRVDALGSLSSPALGVDTVPINEADVVGLVDDLLARPVKGAGYAPGRIALVNETGAIESVAGDPSDCVRVDGSTTPCGAAAPGFVDSEPPGGIVDGSNCVFTLAAAPNPAGSLTVYRNGLLQKAGQDYTAEGSTIEFVAAAVPQPGDTLLVSYRIGGESSGSTGSLGYPTPQVLCSGTGTATTGTDLASLGTCTIAAGLLAPGDRVEIRYDLEHSGSGSGFNFELHWGATTVAARDGVDVLMTGRADAAITASGAQLSFQSWGTVLPFSAGVAGSTESAANGLTVDFRGKLAAAGDSLELKGFSVVRIP